MQDVDKVVMEIFEEVIGYEWEDVKPGDDLIIDLGMDSLDLERLGIELEDRLKVRIDDGYFDGIRTVGQLIESLKQLAVR